MSRSVAILTVAALLLLLLAWSPVSAQEQDSTGRKGIEKTAAAHKEVLSPAEKLAVSERALYTVSMNLIQREWDSNNVARVLELLEETKDSKYRGFEWGYWNRLCHLDRMTLTDHVGGVTVAAYSPDGRSLLTGGWGDRTVKIRDAATGKVTRAIQMPRPSRGTWGVNAAAFSPDGRRLVTCSNYTVIVWNALTGEELTVIKEHQGVIRAVFSPDGTRIATAGLDGWAHIFDAQSGKRLLTIKERSVGSLYSIAFSPDGKRLASGSDANLVLVWDAETGAQLLALKGHTQQINTVAFTPDSKRLVSGSYDNTAKVWEVETGKEALTFRGHTGAISTLAVTPDGSRLVTGSADSSARVWNLETGQELLALKGHTARINSVAVSPDGKRLVTGSDDDTAKVWDIDTDKEAPAPTRSGSRLTLTSAADETKPGEIPPSKLPFLLNGRGVTPRIYSPDRRLVAIYSGKTASVWDIATGKQLCLLEGHAGEVFALAFSPDGARIVSGSGDNTAKVWEVATGKALQTFTGHAGAVKAVAFFPDGRRIVTGSLDSTARIWDIQTGAALCVLKGHIGEVYAVSVQCAGNRVVTGGRDGSARIWHGLTGRFWCALAGQSGAVANFLTLSPNGRRAFTGLAAPILWDAVTGRKIDALRGLRADYYPVAFSPDSRRALSGGNDGVAKLYDAETGKETLTFAIARPRFWITHVAFTQDGKHVVIRSGNDAIAFVSQSETGKDR